MATFPQGYLNIGGGYIHNELPVALLVLVVAAVVLGFVLHATRFGRYLFAIGIEPGGGEASPACRSRACA